MQGYWDDDGKLNVGDGREGDVFKQTKDAYGDMDTKGSDEKTGKVLSASRSIVIPRGDNFTPFFLLMGK